MVLKFLNIFLLILGSVEAINAQNFVLESSIPIRQNEEVLAFPWTGGFTAPQFNLMDLDFDGVDDLVVFDRYSSKIFTFLKEPSGYRYAPQYATIFPATLEDWVLLRDFNGDGLKDIFTSTALGMVVFVNTTSDEDFSWRLFHSRLPGPSPLLTQGFNSAINLQMNASDKPAIADVDGDGDLDILVFRFAGGSSVEYHKNYSLENSGNLDSLQLKRETSAWGGFRECFCGDFAFNNEDCGPPPGRPLHEGGKTLSIQDLTGDGLPEVMVSEESCDELFYLLNDGTMEEAYMSEVLPYLPGEAYPFFPAAFLEDVNDDGLSDMILATNWPSPTQERNEIVSLLLNGGTVDIPSYNHVSDRFILDGMIDIGGMSHPAFSDVNGDGLSDLVMGHYVDGESSVAGLWYFKNTGTAGSPAFELTDQDFGGIRSSQFLNLRPFFLDVVGNGLPDLVFSALSESGHEVYYIPHSGKMDSPYSGQPQVITSGFGSQDVISFIHLDDDIEPDMLIGRVNGRVDYYKGSRVNGILTFSLVQEGIYGLDQDNSRGPTFLQVTDIDGDGNNDLFRSDREGNTAWLPDYANNISQQWDPVMLKESENTDRQYNAGRNLAPVFVNIMNLDRPQLVMGSAGGGLQLFTSQNSSPLPEPEGVTLYPNPVVDGYFYLQAPSTVMVQIIDSTGRILSDEFQVSPGQRVSTSHLNAGLYIFRINSPGLIQSLKFVVKR